MIASNAFEAAEFDCVTALVALDLSAAFDTIDQQVLVRRLEQTFGIKGPTFGWTKSYFERRWRFVKVGNAASTTLRADTDVPQGSVVGPLLLFTVDHPTRR